MPSYLKKIKSLKQRWEICFPIIPVSFLGGKLGNLGQFVAPNHSNRKTFSPVGRPSSNFIIYLWIAGLGQCSKFLNAGNIRKNKSVVETKLQISAGEGLWKALLIDAPVVTQVSSSATRHDKIESMVVVALVSTREANTLNAVVDASANSSHGRSMHSITADLYKFNFKTPVIENHQQAYIDSGGPEAARGHSRNLAQVVFGHHAEFVRDGSCAKSFSPVSTVFDHFDWFSGLLNFLLGALFEFLLQFLVHVDATRAKPTQRENYILRGFFNCIKYNYHSPSGISDTGGWRQAMW